MKSPTRHRIVIIGGGTGGIAVAARLARALPTADLTIVEPSDRHYYQPLWTLVGAGASDLATTVHDEAGLIPAGARWVRDRVATVDADHDFVTTVGGQRLDYDFLVVAPGIKILWDAIDGLPAALGHDGVCSNYSFESVESTWTALQATREGNAIFTYPNTPVKCGGAPQKIMWLAEHHFRRTGVRDRVNVIFASAGKQIFGIEKYRRALEVLVVERGVDTRFHHNLVAIRAASREAVFHDLDAGDEVVLPYAMLHVTPPMGPPDFIAQSPLASPAGWVDVDKATLQHTRYANVFSLGDASSLPTSKTGAAIRKQAPVLVHNLLATIAGQPLDAAYDGYTSCPLITGYGRLILAEFNYAGEPVETFPFDQSKERLSMYLLKKYALPQMYWHGMMRGRA